LIESVYSFLEGIKQFTKSSSTTVQNQSEFQDGRRENADVIYSFSIALEIIQIHLN
jgi:hypothetical protein